MTLELLERPDRRSGGMCCYVVIYDDAALDEL
jgi:hypothetical protein